MFILIGVYLFEALIFTLYVVLKRDFFSNSCSLELCTPELSLLYFSLLFRLSVVFSIVICTFRLDAGYPENRWFRKWSIIPSYYYPPLSELMFHVFYLVF